MATVTESSAAAPHRRHSRARGLRLQAGAGSLAGKLLLVRGRVQLHLDPDRRHGAVRVRRTLTPGPGVWWTWPVVVVGQILVALCFMEMAAQYPIAGSVYQWSKQISSALHLVDDRLDLHRRRDRDDHRRRDRLAGRAARRSRPTSSSSAAPPTPARRSPSTEPRTRCCSAAILIVHHDHHQHARRQADVADQQRRRDLRAGRREPPDHPAAVPPAPLAVGHRPLLRLRRRPSVGLLRRAARRRNR